MPVINSILSWVMKKRMHQIELFLKYPHEVQEDWLMKLLKSAKKTEWGKKFDYTSIKNEKEFKERIPVQDYESLKPYIKRIQQGEQNLLWNTEIKWFAKSSGTSSDKSKFIPVSQEALEECHYKGGKDAITFYCTNNPNTELFTGKTLSLGGSQQISSFDSDIYYGDLSAILMKNLPFWCEFIRTPNLSIALITDWEEKIEKLTDATISENVTSLAGVPSWFLVLLKHISQKTGRNNLHDIWPNLELFIHGGVSFEPYREQFRKLLPSNKMRYLETYNASEGFFGIQDRNNANDMLLLLDYGIYYEFMPLEDLHKENPKTQSLDEVELNTTYALIISTNAGLWRYMIGDTIKFTSLNPFRIQITGRTKHFINAFGEELMIDNAESALSKTCKEMDISIKEYTAAPVYFSDKENAAHEWLIEFEKDPSDIELFTDLLDKYLKEANSDYEAKRSHDLSLCKPIVRVMPKDTFYTWMKEKGKLGGQNKVPRLSNDRKYVDEILKIYNKAKI